MSGSVERPEMQDCSQSGNAVSKRLLDDTDMLGFERMNSIKGTTNLGVAGDLEIYEGDKPLALSKQVVLDAASFDAKLNAPMSGSVEETVCSRDNYNRIHVKTDGDSVLSGDAKYQRDTVSGDFSQVERLPVDPHYANEATRKTEIHMVVPSDLPKNETLVVEGRMKDGRKFELEGEIDDNNVFHGKAKIGTQVIDHVQIKLKDTVKA